MDPDGHFSYPLTSLKRMRTFKARNEIKRCLKPRKKRRFKVATAINVAMSTGMFLLFSFEYKYMMAVSYPPVLIEPPATRNLRIDDKIAFRTGFVPRKDLRTDQLHEKDVFLKGIHREERKEYTSHPRVLALYGETENELLTTSDDLSRYRLPEHINSTVPILGNYSCCSQEPDYYIKDFERPFLEQCEPMINPSVHPNCNALHELDLESDITLIATSGSWRTTWKVDADSAVLKMLNYERTFDQESMQAHAMDSMVMDQLTSSPYTVNEYGFCSQSVLTEWAPIGGRDHVKSYDIRNRERLKIARDLARGLADIQSLRHLHSYSEINRTSIFAHNDINIANTVFVDGKVKWNDFNIGVLLRNEKLNASMPCGAPVLFKGDMWRSPEEILNTSYVDTELSDVLKQAKSSTDFDLSKLRTFSLCTKRNRTHKEPEGKLSVADVAERKRIGRWPTIPEQYKNTSKPELITLYAATVSCLHPNPAKRPTAFELANALELIYDRLKNKEKVNRFLIGGLFFSK
eukprot:scaffold20339_cov128-Cylindrotheca_fusiformis.AAC.11